MNFEKISFENFEDLFCENGKIKFKLFLLEKDFSTFSIGSDSVEVYSKYCSTFCNEKYNTSSPSIDFEIFKLDNFNLFHTIYMMKFDKTFILKFGIGIFFPKETYNYSQAIQIYNFYNLSVKIRDSVLNYCNMEYNMSRHRPKHRDSEYCECCVCSKSFKYVANKNIYMLSQNFEITFYAVGEVICKYNSPLYIISH